ncbi:MAG: glycosyltransferase family 2 protein [Lachnospiraceae bacterium]|nr:glycosyltransferase family 2 protein [Lachnospiraceae bacterium]
MTDISIAIVAFNNEEDVRNAVCSIQEHTAKIISKKIYIIDNSTQKNHLKTLQSEEIVYIKTERNLGFGAGHNLILRELDSVYHAIINPDILLREDSLFILKEFVERENAMMAVPKILDEDGTLQKSYRRDITFVDLIFRRLPGSFGRKRKAHHTMQDMDFTKPFSVPFAHGCFYLIRTEIFLELNGFDPRFFLYMEDADLCRRVHEKGKLLYCPDTVVIHKWEKGSSKSKKLFWIHIRSMCSYFKKWGWKLW